MGDVVLAVIVTVLVNNSAAHNDARVQPHFVMNAEECRLWQEDRRANKPRIVDPATQRRVAMVYYECISVAEGSINREVLSTAISPR